MKRKLAIIVLAVLTCLFSVCGVACFENGNSSKFELVSFEVTGIEQTNELGEYEVESNIVNVSIYLTHEIEGEFSELSLQRGSDGQIFVIDKTIEKYNCTITTSQIDGEWHTLIKFSLEIAKQYGQVTSYIVREISLKDAEGKIFKFDTKDKEKSNIKFKYIGKVLPESELSFVSMEEIDGDYRNGVYYIEYNELDLGLIFVNKNHLIFKELTLLDKATNEEITFDSSSEDIYVDEQIIGTTNNTIIEIFTDFNYNQDYIGGLQIVKAIFADEEGEYYSIRLEGDSTTVKLAFIGCEEEYSYNKIIKDNIIYEITREGLLVVGNTFEELTDVVIPSTVTYGKNYLNKTGKTLPVVKIKEQAFDNGEFINSIVVPESVTHIEDYAFCGFDRDKVSIPETTEVSDLAFELFMPKTQLYVSHFTSGYGTSWIKKMKKDFEEAYRYVSFEEGKRGVEVMINDHVTLGDAMDFHVDDNYVFFLESNDYNTQAIDEKEILDITDVVKGTFDINGVPGHESTPDVDASAKAIFEKFNATQKSALNLGTENFPAYYGIPWYEGFYGLTYDARLFNDKYLYFDKYGNLGVKENDPDISAGPNNVYGDYDDGLPATYEQFFELCDEMVNNNIVPLVFAGGTGQHFYITNLINALIADYNGVAKERLNYDFNGTTEIITGWNGTTPVLSPVTITNANGYNIFRQPSYYYGLEFLRNLIKENKGQYLYKDCFSDSFPWTDAQTVYLKANITNEPDIAMLAEGVWWANEASSEFVSLSQSYLNASAMERDLRFMPLPKHSSQATGTGARRTTLLESQKSMMYISTETPVGHVPLCKLFLQFCNTQSSIEDFTVLTNTSRALTYELSEESYNKLTPYGKSILEMKNSPYTDIVYQFSTNPLYAYNMSTFKKHWTLSCFGQTYPSHVFAYSSKTAKDVFAEVAYNWEDDWARYFNEYI